MFTKYHFTLTVIMLINLCGCYTVTPSAKGTGAIVGKDCNVSFGIFLANTESWRKKTKRSLEKIFKILYLSWLASHLICWIHVWWLVSSVVNLHLIHISHSDSISLSLDTFLLSFCSSPSRFISSHIFFSPTSQLCVSRVWILPRHVTTRCSAASSRTCL